MSIETIITDGHGTSNKLKINGEGELTATLHPHPPKNEAIASVPFQQYFTDDGLADGTFDMQIAASSASPTDYYIEADNELDIYIKTCSVIIADQNATLNLFGTIAALTNGVVFSWITTDKGTVTIHDGLKSNFDFVKLGLGTPTIGATTTSFRASNVEGNSEGYIPTINFEALFGIPFGLRLRAGTKDRLVWKVQDDTTGVDAFNITAYGFKF